jgi:hypothetical protein
MKNLFLVGLCLSFGSAFAAPSNKTIEAGLYNAVDVETGTINAQLVIHPNGTLNFKVNSPDFEMPEPGCDGTYAVSGNSFTSNLTCPIAILPEVSVNIDITAVTPQTVRSAEGALVPVVIDALGTDATIFRLKIVTSKK